MPENRRVDEEVEEMLTVKHHDRDALQVAAVKVVVGLDVVLDEREGELVAQRGELDAGVIAEVTAGAAVEVDGGHYRARWPVAATTGRNASGSLITPSRRLQPQPASTL
jgi:hypothetical protein